MIEKTFFLSCVVSIGVRAVVAIGMSAGRALVDVVFSTTSILL
jgi:hypothetical protein